MYLNTASNEASCLTGLIVPKKLVRQVCPLTLSQTSPGFYMPVVQVFLKTLWEKGKLLVKSNFPFSHSVFYPFKELSAIFH